MWLARLWVLALQCQALVRGQQHLVGTGLAVAVAVFAGVVVALGLLILGIIGMRFQQKVGHYGIHMAKRR